LCYYGPMVETHIVKEEDMGALAERVLSLLENVNKDSARVILLQGDLGAGKTTFTKELGALLGVDKNDINSPTFILKKEYTTHHPVHRKLIHIDAYRFNDPSEAKVLRLSDDIKESGNLISIEWPSKMTYVAPDMEITFMVIDEDTREASLLYEKDI
jgi:tRNA threonylcarbamoyladenosine biosynthesis protein TsaE